MTSTSRTGMRYVIIGSAVLLLLLIIFAVAKGFLDVHAEEKCRLGGGTWQCAATSWWKITVVGCDCIEPIEETPAAPVPVKPPAVPTTTRRYF